MFSMNPKHKPAPGPRGLPIIGHLHLLGKQPHRSLYELSKKYGPIMSLRLGSVPTIVVSTSAASELFLKTHDTVFASRPKLQAADYLWYGSKGMIFSEYGTYWRNLRKFCTLELLSSTKIASMAAMRREEVVLLVESLKKAAKNREVVDVSQKMALLMEGMTCRMLFGKSRDKRFDLNAIIHELTIIVGAFNIADFIPFLRALDLQGLTRRLKETNRAVDEVLETIIDEHEQDARDGCKKLDRDFVDVLISLKNNPSSTHEQVAQNLDRSTIKAIVLDMISGTIDTSQIAITWIMSELLRNSRVMKKLQKEVQNVVGDCEFVEESYISKLDYLDMIVKESMRLHPVATLLPPHESMEDIVINGYHIKKKSRIIVNNWGIGRDPRNWSEDVDEFLPERFIGSNVDYMGNNFQLIPFGSGRRSCPGIHLGTIMVKLVVTQLVHTFDWELPFGMSPDELDMEELFGATVPRATHLLAVPTLRSL
ncbi:putative flavonoid 3'-monooxygenase [Heracleum sosnowskyi]|uniref:Flavonoid 3'-monooxygenase n=1 Tax=Heracleum sosnowskyi TaxID=360622 RepID=A0AAD8JBP2_9APIA|nr:putative flavonoid 3'-monooxygenase [Heracleum sosnowskyi]KAK1400154.1 putative flavonoid 3'-monooxygenase [Heracleum sosnowskyi]